jgi:hypothetical protein
VLAKAAFGSVGEVRSSGTKHVRRERIVKKQTIVLNKQPGRGVIGVL